jgi:hypothetical protein
MEIVGELLRPDVSIQRANGEGLQDLQGDLCEKVRAVGAATVSRHLLQGGPSFPFIVSSFFREYSLWTLYSLDSIFTLDMKIVDFPHPLIVWIS